MFLIIWQVLLIMHIKLTMWLIMHKQYEQITEIKALTTFTEFCWLDMIILMIVIANHHLAMVSVNFSKINVVWLPHSTILVCYMNNAPLFNTHLITANSAKDQRCRQGDQRLHKLLVIYLMRKCEIRVYQVLRL